MVEENRETLQEELQRLRLENTHLRQALAKVEEKKGAETCRTLLERVFQQIPVGVLLQGQNGEILLSNPAALRLLGQTEEPLQNQTSLDPFMNAVREDGSAFPEEEHPVSRVIAMHKPVQNVVMGVKHSRTGDRIWLLVNVYPNVAEDGTFGDILCTFSDITSRKRIEQALRMSEERFATMIYSSPIPIVMTRMQNGLILDVNWKYAQMLGYSREQLIGKTAQEMQTWARFEEREKMVRQLREQGTLQDYSTQFRTRSGEIRELMASYSRITIEGEECILAMMRDITELRQVEEQFYQAQKMESIGRLAGGVAHDFNNLLTAIIGYAELALQIVPEGDELESCLTPIRRAADRAATLTAQLLAFARKQIVRPQSLDLSERLLEMTSLLQRLLGEDIELVLLPEEALWRVYLDAGQFEQIVINLVVNARDAMPDGGKLVLGTSNVFVTQEMSRFQEALAPGDYVLMTVRDTGFGIPEEMHERVFEPFFTTKEIGKGTGLGLATCYGIIKQNGGHIQFSSEVGKGTIFSIYFPRSAEQSERDPQDATHLTFTGVETILLVEDETIVREMTERALVRLGYQVLTASDGAEALLLASEYRGTIHLLLTDRVMPQMSGRQLAERLQQLRPDMLILYVSGYNRDTSWDSAEDTRTFLPKPYTTSLLAQKLRSLLDNR